MKLVRYGRHFAKFHRMLGLGAATRFSMQYMWARILPRKAFYTFSVGPYTITSPALDDFVGRLVEIFINDAYVLESTEKPLYIIDCGANIGVALLYFKLKAPNAQVLCFEPNTNAREMLKKNIAANKWERSVRVEPYALGSRSGRSDFFVEVDRPTSSSGSIIPDFNEGERTMLTVEVKPLSPYVTGDVDILKVDIEGAEFEVLGELAHSGVLARVAAIQLEFHYMPPVLAHTLGATLTMLERAGFTTYVASHTSPAQVLAGDGSFTCQIFAWRAY